MFLAPGETRRNTPHQPAPLYDFYPETFCYAAQYKRIHKVDPNQHNID
jgi:hypothetical protein